MPSKLTEKLRYIQDRCSNAYWMLKKGKFKLIWTSIWTEVTHRKEQFQAWTGGGNIAHGNIGPAHSPRPVRLQDADPGPGPDPDPDSAYTNKRKVFPASYRPTGARLSPLGALQIDNQAVANELGDIISTFTIQENINS